MQRLKHQTFCHFASLKTKPFKPPNNFAKCEHKDMLQTLQHKPHCKHPKKINHLYVSTLKNVGIKTQERHREAEGERVRDRNTLQCLKHKALQKL